MARSNCDGFHVRQGGILDEQVRTFSRRDRSNT